MRISDWSSDVCSSDLLVIYSPLPLAGWAGGGPVHTRRVCHSCPPLTPPASGRGFNYPAASPSPAGRRPSPRPLLRSVRRAARRRRRSPLRPDRESAGEGTGGYVRVALGGRRLLKKTK